MLVPTHPPRVIGHLLQSFVLASLISLPFLVVGSAFNPLQCTNRATSPHSAQLAVKSPTMPAFPLFPLCPLLVFSNLRTRFARMRNTVHHRAPQDYHRSPHRANHPKLHEQFKYHLHHIIPLLKERQSRVLRFSHPLEARIARATFFTLPLYRLVWLALVCCLHVHTAQPSSPPAATTNAAPPSLSS